MASIPYMSKLPDYLPDLESVACISPVAELSAANAEAAASAEAPESRPGKETLFDFCFCPLREKKKLSCVIECLPLAPYRFRVLDHQITTRKSMNLVTKLRTD